MSKRIALWDNLKFALILFVVIGHYTTNIHEESYMLKHVYYFIYTFHMPVFIFVTGLFSKKVVNEKNIKKILPYLTCYFVTASIIYLTKLTLGMEANLSIFSPGGLPWYLMSMFFMFIITMLIKDLKPVYVLIISILVGVMVGFANETNTDFLTWMRTMIFYPFFYLGYITDQSKIIEKVKKRYIQIIAFVFFGGIYGLILAFPDKCGKLSNLCTARHPYEHLTDYEPQGWLFRIMMYGIGIAACYLIISITPNKRIFGATKLGERTLGIYMFHYPVIYIIMQKTPLLEKLKELLPSMWDHVIILVAIATAIFCGNYIFDYISRKLFSTNWKLRE